MSFILDALKKSEAERQRQAGPALLEMRVVAPQRRLPLWAIGLGVLLAINVLVLGWFALRPAAPSTTPAAVPAAVATPAPPAGDRTAPPATVAPPVGAALRATGSGVPGAGAEGAGTAGVTASAGRSGADVDESDADLEPAVAPGTPGAAAAQAAGPQAAGGAREESASHGLQNYVELAGRIPPLRLDLHVYAANPAERYAFINMHRLREGESTPEGVQVKQITRDGVVLDYRGTGFFLGHD